jgi:BlaI family penicillinase repressor
MPQLWVDYPGRVKPFRWPWFPFVDVFSAVSAQRRLTKPLQANIFALGENFRHDAPSCPPMSKSARIHLTRRESEIMEILHRRRRATIEEIRSELPNAPSRSSVRKLLEIMIARGLLRREYEGPRYVYFPVAKPEDASRSALQQLVRTFFDNSPTSAVAALLDAAETPLTNAEYKRLRALLKRVRDLGGQR